MKENVLITTDSKGNRLVVLPQIIFSGKDFTNEFPFSVYTKKLNGALAKAKANLVQGIPKLIEIATEKRWSEDFEKRHKRKAEKGWYRYTTRFAMPIANNEGVILRYNVFRAVLVVRYASDGKLYLYDIIIQRKRNAINKLTINILLFSTQDDII